MKSRVWFKGPVFYCADGKLRSADIECDGKGLPLRFQTADTLGLAC